MSPKLFTTQPTEASSEQMRERQEGRAASACAWAVAAAAKL